MKVLSEKQVEVFNELLNEPEFRGKKSLKHLLWLNTTTPKFKVGDAVAVRADGSMSIWDKPVRYAFGVVEGINVFRFEDEYHYAVECTFEKEGKRYTTTVPGKESNITLVDKSIININWGIN